MRFERIELPAFGPFSNFALDLGDRPGALHVLYGPNEAGKSSLLRALIALLYGVPPRSGDGHTHDFARLRIGALLRNEDGSLLHVVRRKGLKHTLLDREERPLAEAVLTPFLGGLDEALFRQMFGLDHVRLREGAEALLSGGGHLGEGLFDAGTGARTIRHALDALRAESEALYKPRGRTPKLNVSVELVREQRRKLRDALLSPQAYVDQRKALAEAQTERERVSEERRLRITEQARVTRQLALLPLLGQHALLCAEEGRLTAQLAEGAGARLALGSELGEALRTLREQLSTLHALRAEEPRRSGACALLTREIELLTARLGPVSRLSGELDTAGRARFRRFAEEERTLLSERAQLERRVGELAERLAQAQARLAAMRERSEEPALAELVERAEREDLVRVLARAEAEQSRERAALERGLAQLGTTLTPTTLATSSFPSEAHLRTLEDAHDALTRELEQLVAAEQKNATERALATRRRAELLAQGPMITERDLEAAHAERAATLRALVEAWRHGRPFDAPLVQAHERMLTRVDELALRMRSESHRYAELARIDAELAQQHEERAVITAAREAHALRRATADREREAELSALGLPPPLPIRELRGRVAKLIDLAARSERLLQLQLECERCARTATVHADALAELLGVATPAAAIGQVAANVGPGPRLEQLLHGARATLAALREQKSEARHLATSCEQLATDLAIARARLATVCDAEAALRARFHELLRHHDLSAPFAADELLACLDELAELAQKQRELEVQHERARQLAAAESAFREELARLSERVGLSLEGRSDAQALDALNALQQAHLEASRVLTRVRCQREELEGELRKLADGAPIEELRRAVGELDADLARARKLELDAELEQLAEQLREVDQRLGALSAGLARLEEPSSAVELAEQAECELASARALAQRYVETRLALTLLTREIERYRAAHQGPVLARASQLFPRLTLGRYVGLEVDYDERDEPVLTCVQRGGKRVRVEGLSDGTRDQLYLALRIASIERYLDANPALPLILDDAFVHFDDARAAAALSVLTELAGRTQVLFFTHHTRMVELARRTLVRERVVVHQLGGDTDLPGHDHGPLFA